jgi:crossover junction endodeoxyribonuclease RuvC
VVRVLGVDPGLTRCGVGVVEGTPGRTLTLVEVGVIESGRHEPLAQRLLAISNGLDEWLDRLQPDVVAVERVFFQHNVSTAMGTAQVGALALVAASRRGIAVASHTPSEVKAAVTGSGRAGKEQVGTMVARLLGLTAIPRPADSADALALAICQIWRGPALAREEAAMASMKRSAR